MNKVSSNSTVFNVPQAAQQLGISHQCLRNWIEEGDAVPSYYLNGRHPLFTRDDLREISKLVATSD